MLERAIAALKADEAAALKAFGPSIKAMMDCIWIASPTTSQGLINPASDLSGPQCY
jgi:hypothetical protein